MFITDIYTTNGATVYNELYDTIRGYLRAPGQDTISKMLLGNLDEALKECKSRGIGVYPSSISNGRVLFKGRNETTITTELGLHGMDIVSIHLTIPFSSRWHAEDILMLVPSEFRKSINFTIIGSNWEQRTLRLSEQPQYQGDLADHPF